MCGTFLNRHAYLKQIIFSFIILILLTDSYSSNEPDIEGTIKVFLLSFTYVKLLTYSRKVLGDDLY